MVFHINSAGMVSMKRNLFDFSFLTSRTERHEQHTALTACHTIPRPSRTWPSRATIVMDSAGMSFSLQSRDVIADSIETVMGGQWYDANIAIPGCDKNMPGCLIAMGRVNRPAIMVRLCCCCCCCCCCCSCSYRCRCWCRPFDPQPFRQTCKHG